jgi:glycosyltransferase involved in cell wall biosynthesis
MTRVAVTIEQCWHEVPGGTAAAAIDSIRALQHHGPAGLELVGVAARHRTAPPAPWTPPLPVHHLPLPRLALYETWHRLRWPAVERATGPVDVIHVTGMAMPPPSAPLVVTVNDLVFLHHPELFTRHGVKFFDRAIELTKRDAAVVVCPSSATVTDCVAHGFDRGRLRLVPYGIEVEPATEDEIAAVRRRYDLDGPFVLWLGTIEPRKNIPALLRAFAGVEHDAVLVIAGGAGWNEDLDPLADRLGSRVRRIGFVDESVKAALYAAATVFCLPSLLEGFGLPVLEAMAQGTPVITSRGTSTEELVAADPAEGLEEAGVLVDPGDEDGLRAALQALLDDGDARTRMRVAARRRAAWWSPERTAAGLVAAYEEAQR